MGRSYLGCRENISTGQIMLFCSYGEMFSRLPGEVSRSDVDFVKCKQNVFPLRWLPTVAGQIYTDQCDASPTGKCFEMNNT